MDDDGAGYKDDGEEHLGIEEDPAEVRKRVLLEQMDREDSKSAKRLKKLTTSSTVLPSQRDSMTRFLQPAGMMSKKEISSSVSQSHVAGKLFFLSSRSFIVLFLYCE